VSLEGVIPFASTFDVVGWFARDGEVLEKVGRVLMGDETAPEEPRRLLVARDAFDLLESDVANVLDNAAAVVSIEIGAVREVVVSEDGLAEWYQIFRTLQGFEIWENHGAWVTDVRPKLGPGIRDRYEWASTISPADALSARVAHSEIRQRITQMFEPGDILCLPTSPRVAPMKNEPVDRVEVEYREQALHLLCVAGLGGLPQVSVPLATMDGLPLGLSLVGAPGSDTQLLALARSLMDRKYAGDPD